MSERKCKVVVVGAGASGILTAVQLARAEQGGHSPGFLEVVLASGQKIYTARGVAYSTDVLSHCLNVPAAKMGAFPDDVSHFHRWLQSQGHSVSPSAFVPRLWYAHYLQTLLNQALEDAQEHGSLRLIEEEVISVIPCSTQQQRAIVRFASGQTCEADAVVLALGNYPGRPPASPESSFYQDSRFIANVWRPNALAQVDSEQPALIVGTGLTMVDQAMSLLENPAFNQPVFAISRRGMLPQTHDLSYAPRVLEVPQSVSGSIRLLVRWVRQEVQRADADGEDWRAVVDGLRPHTQALWRSLGHEDRRRFLRHVRPYWENHRHRIAPSIAQKLNRWMASGRLRVLAGPIMGYQPDDGGITVCYRPRGTQRKETVRVGTVLNCSGSEATFWHREEPLVQQLIRDGYLTPHVSGMGVVANADGALIDRNGLPSTQLFTLGPPLKGELWETTAIPEIRVQAARLAAHMHANLGPEPEGHLPKVLQPFS